MLRDISQQHRKPLMVHESNIAKLTGGDKNKMI